ncbi:hypothetical protein PsorP6_012019 [Peronosclerospora sorghi]|uniref:Uncharacterized protein n=1 Tax=Peronosclerospora sorghi TaxID=230839 RepID=A0ACC0WJT9_9STRA|nr:hypothetical protein PsorP6_012019 [Peronosclerospora sorghi]
MCPRYLPNVWFLLLILADYGVDASGTARDRNDSKSDCCSNVRSAGSDQNRSTESAAVVSNREEERMFSPLETLSSFAERLVSSEGFEYHPVSTSEYEEFTEKVFQHPEIKRWVNNPYYVITSKEAAKVITSLTDEIGDSALYYVLDTASKADAKHWEEHNRVRVAEKLKIQQVDYWTQVKRDPEIVFKAYGLAEEGRNILRGPEFWKWLIYVGQFNKHPGITTQSATTILLKHHSRDGLYQYIEDARLSYDRSMKKHADTLKKMLEKHKEVTTG